MCICARGHASALPPLRPHLSLSTPPPLPNGPVLNTRLASSSQLTVPRYDPNRPSSPKPETLSRRQGLTHVRGLQAQAILTVVDAV